MICSVEGERGQRRDGHGCGAAQVRGEELAGLHLEQELGVVARGNDSDEHVAHGAGLVSRLVAATDLAILRAVRHEVAPGFPAVLGVRAVSGLGQLGLAAELNEFS